LIKRTYKAESRKVVPHAEKVKAKARAAVTFGAVVEPYLEAVAPHLRPAYLAEAGQ
jgi:hypothetical protein